MHLVCAVQDRSLGDYAARLKRLGAQGRVVLAGALNAAAAEVRPLTVRAEARQTGLPEKTVDKSQRVAPASPSSLTWVARAQGGNIKLKYFGAEETSAGVVAHPLGQAQVFAHAFTKGGRFPDRVALGLKDQVFERSGAGRLPIHKVRSGVLLPAEMVRGQTAQVFREGVATIVATAVVTRLGAMV